ncbi:hypothetical protein CDEST_10393 [Colletotrichum destructivum]|uniref:Uncharacterized protein n=1 Tax=Colletotrichum destructivum TaxID=34406 RepID=A0AAX4IPM0_9PEZI|nr:hypothetical protein CDEST_10393 [Colletotrichum destructivum]
MEMEQPFLPTVNATIVQTAVDVAMAFEHFELPVAMMLLGISPYDLPNSVTTILKVLLDNYTKEKVQSTMSLTWFMFGADAERLLKIERWRDLHIRVENRMTLNIDDVRRRAEEGDTPTNAFAGLKL